MDIEELVWLPAVEEKLVSKHNITPVEVEEVFDNQPWITFVETGHFQREDVYAGWGQTDAGRCECSSFTS